MVGWCGFVVRVSWVGLWCGSTRWVCDGGPVRVEFVWFNGFSGGVGCCWISDWDQWLWWFVMVVWWL